MFIAQAPVVTRKDLWQKAGIDFDSNWPIKDSDHFLEICKAFKTSKVVEFPTEVYGKIWDAARHPAQRMDSLPGQGQKPFYNQGLEYEQR